MRQLAAAHKKEQDILNAAEAVKRKDANDAQTADYLAIVEALLPNVVKGIEHQAANGLYTCCFRHENRAVAEHLRRALIDMGVVCGTIAQYPIEGCMQFNFDIRW